MALRGYRPILEIMFGDFIALGFDQIVNGIAQVPRDVRRPGARAARRAHADGRRPRLRADAQPVAREAAARRSRDHGRRRERVPGPGGARLTRRSPTTSPVFLIEHKADVRPPQPPAGRRLRRRARLPRDRGAVSGADVLRATASAAAAATIVTYGGMLPAALDAAVELILEEEVFTEVVALGRLLPLDLEPGARVGRPDRRAASRSRRGRSSAGIGAEIAARVQSEAWEQLRAPVRRVAAVDGISRPRARSSAAVLPDARRHRRGRARGRARERLGAARDRPHPRGRKQRVGAARRVARRRRARRSARASRSA